MLDRADVEQMIAEGDINFDKYQELADKAGINCDRNAILDAIGMQEDDDDEEFINHLRKLIT